MNTLSGHALHGMKVVVVGAGVFGLAVGIASALQGAQVVIYDDRPLGDNASGIAAGMLAPAFEAIESDVADRYRLYRQARDLWPGFLEALGQPSSLLDRSGALRILRAEDAPSASVLLERLTSMGAAAELLTGAQARALQPRLGGAATGALYTPDDWRLDPAAVLGAMAAAFRRAGGRLETWRAEPNGGGLAERGSRLQGDALVLAAGAACGGWAPLAPEVSVLTPIKGQIVHYDDAPPSAGPVIRAASIYLVPQGRGVLAGATMEHGVADRRVDPAAVALLAREAAMCFPHLGGARWRGFAAVRAATPDGLPLAGRSRSGVLLATGARRNGWLLAPLVAQTIVAALADEGLASPVPAFDPRRFTPSAKQTYGRQEARTVR